MKNKEKKGKWNRRRRRRMKNEEESKSSMTPWEQHTSVISIPHFDYNSPSSLLQRSRFAFLIICTIKREKSATKEAIYIFSKYVGSFNSGTSGCSKNSDANANTKRRKICTKEIDRNIANSVDSTKINQGAGDNPKYDCFSLIKLTRSGLLLFTFPGRTF